MGIEFRFCFFFGITISSLQYLDILLALADNLLSSSFAALMLSLIDIHQEFFPPII